MVTLFLPCSCNQPMFAKSANLKWKSASIRNEHRPKQWHLDKACSLFAARFVNSVSQIHQWQATCCAHHKPRARNNASHGYTQAVKHVHLHFFTCHVSALRNNYFSSAFPTSASSTVHIRTNRVLKKKNETKMM